MNNPSAFEADQDPAVAASAAAAAEEEQPMMDESAPAPEVENGGEEENEPDWQELMLHQPARAEVPTFLAARGRRSAANENFAVSLDVVHESVTQSKEALLEVVSSLLNSRAEKLVECEEGLKYDYVTNDKARARMNKKLEESARMAQGLFANLLMRVAQPTEDASVASGFEGMGDATDAAGNDDGAGDAEPDWRAICQHEPARTEVPTFLAARGRREAACARFEGAIEEFSVSIEGYVEDLTQAVADLYNNRTMKLDEYECLLKQDYAENDKMRARMQGNLEESAAAAHGMFQELMQRVLAPGMGMPGQQQVEQQAMPAGILTQATTLGNSP